MGDKRPPTRRVWEVGKDGEAERSYYACPYTAGAVYITHEAMSKVTLLMEHVHGEWLAYLDGYILPTGEPVIAGLRVPPQEASQVGVEVKEWVPSPTHVGVMHSHHTLGCDFSYTDHRFVNANHRLSVLAQLVDGRVSLTCQYRQEVACGVLITTRPPVRLWSPVSKEDEDWLLSSLANIRETRPEVSLLPSVIALWADPDD